MIISFETLIAYFENLAEQHVDIATHFRWNKTELQGSLKNGIALPIMLIDSPETQEEDQTKKTFDNHTCAITILGKPDTNTGKVDAYDEQNQVLEYCQQICDDIRMRIKYDGSLGTGPTKWMYGLVVRGSFHFFKVGPLFSEGYYGYRLEFNIKSKTNCEIETPKWKDLAIASATSPVITVTDP